MSDPNDGIYIIIIIILVIILFMFLLRSIGGFTVHSINYYVNSSWKYSIYSLVLACLIMIPIFKTSKPIALISVFLVSVILYIIFVSSGGTNMQNMLPNTNYPPPTHLGLDGVSLETSVSGYVPNT